MAETKLCSICKEIMKPCCYAVGKQDGTERLENKIFSYDGTLLEKEYKINFCQSVVLSCGVCNYQ